MDPFSVASAAAGLISLSIQVSGFTIDFINGVKNAPRVVVSFQEEINALRDVLGQFKAFIRTQPRSTQFTSASSLSFSMTACEAKLKILSTTLSKHVSDSKMKRMMTRMKWPFDEKESRSVILEIHRYTQIFQFSMSIDGLNVLNQTSYEVSKIFSYQIAALLETQKITGLMSQEAVEAVEDRRQISQLLESLNDNTAEIATISTSVGRLEMASNDTRSQNIRRWMCQVDPSTNHNAARKKHEPTTGIWFVESQEFEEWLWSASSLLWLYGTPGCGKTIICSTIINYVQEVCRNSPEAQCAYFYFDFRDKSKQSVPELLGSVISQLSRNSLHSSLLLLHEECDSGSRRPSTEELKHVLLAILIDSTEVYVILDALDECAATERDEIMELLADIVYWRLPQLHILFTSRKERDISEGLLPLHPIEVSLESALLDRDIQHYIEQRLNRKTRLRKMCGDARVREEILRVLIGGANGMFRWVACQLDEIEKCLTPAALKKTLAGLPKTLNETYERILIGIDDAYVDQALMILRSIAFSFGPMEVEEVAEIVAMTPEMPDAAPKLDRSNRLFDAPNDILSICGSLVQLSSTSRAGNFAQPEDESINAVQLSHYSVKEYLTTHGCRFQNGKQYSVTEGLCNTLMAETCLSYLLDMPPARPSRQQVDAEFSSQLTEIDAQFSSHVWEIGYPLKQYAATYWASHANLAEGYDNSQRLQEAILNFLDESNPAFLRWRRYCEPQPPGRSHIPGTTLYYASGFGLTNSVRQIIASGANVNEATGFYYSAIRAAVVLNRKQVVRLLLENGAEPNGTDIDSGKINAYKPWNVNLLELAIERGYVEIARHLVEKGADVNVSLDGEFTILQLAARHGQPETMDLLLQHGADISARNNKGSTSLHSAASNVQEEAVKLLLDKGADVSALNDSGWSALHSACKRCSPETIRLLVERGIDVQVQDEREGRTALQIAAMADREDVVAILIQSGADVSATDFRGRNALHLATLRGHYAVARTLIGAGASVEMVDDIGRNVLDIARQAIPVAFHLRRQIPGRNDVKDKQREDEYVIMCHINEMSENGLNDGREKLYEFLIQEHARGRSRVVVDPGGGTYRITRANSVSIPPEDTKRTRTAIPISP